MLPEERHRKILELLEEKPVVKVQELVNMFGVSLETIRRDLEHLDKNGLVRRIYGGAVKARVHAVEPSYETRALKCLQEKKAIGRCAAELVEDGEAIILDIGTTTLEVARALRKKRNLTALTNSLIIANELLSHENKRVILIGGEVRPGEMASSGFIATQTVRQFRVNKAFLGAAGITVEDGITDFNLAEAEVRKAMLDIAEKVIVVADSTKIGVTALCCVAPLGSIHTLVTDSRASQAELELLRQVGLEVIVAEVGEGEN